MFATIMAVLASRQYQYTHSELYGLVKLKCLLSMAQRMVNSPSVNGSTRRILRFSSRCARTNKGRGIDMIRISLVRLKTRLTMR